MSREQFKTSADSGEKLSAWDDVRAQYEQDQAEKADQARIKAEAERVEARKKALEKGAKDFETRQQKFVSRNNETSYKEYAELHNHLHDLENGNIEEEKAEEFVVSKEDFESAIASSPVLSKMEILAKRMQIATSEEARDKFKKELSELSNQVLAADSLSVNDWHKDDQWKVMQDSKNYDYRSSIVSQIWERALGVSNGVPEDSSETVKIGLDFSEDWEKQAKPAVEAEETMEAEKADADNEPLRPEDLEKKQGRFSKLKKMFGKTAFKAIALLGLGAAGAGIFTAFNTNRNSDANNEPQTHQETKTEIGDENKDPLNKFANFAEEDSNKEVGNNDKYDRENDSFYKFDNKENVGSLGTGIEAIEDSQYINHLKNNVEDNLSFKGQFFRMNEELAQTLLGTNAEGVEALVDAAEKGDQEAFEKLDKAYDTLMAEAKLESGQRALGDQFDSIYRIQEADGTWTYKHADDLNIGGTYRTISTVVNGKTYTFDLRDQCTQLILRDMVVEIPAITPTEYTNFVEPKPPAPTTPENPGKPDTPDPKDPPKPDTPDPKDPPKPDTPDPKDPPKPETPKLDKKDPKVDINVNDNLNSGAKDTGENHQTGVSDGSQFEDKAQDADQTVTYGTSEYQAPPVINFTEEDRAQNTVADLSQATPQEVITEVPSVDANTGESTLNASQQETGAIVDTTDNTYKVEVNYGNTFEQPATPDVNIDDPTQVESLNGATDQNGTGSNTEHVGGF